MVVFMITQSSHEVVGGHIGQELVDGERPRFFNHSDERFLWRRKTMGHRLSVEQHLASVHRMFPGHCSNMGTKCMAVDYLPCLLPVFEEMCNRLPPGLLEFVCCLLLILSIAQAVTADIDLQNSSSHFRASLLGPVVQSLTIVLAMLYAAVERRKGFVTSGILFFYWLLVLLVSIIPFYSKIILQECLADGKKCAIFYTYFSLVLVQFVVSCIAETLPTLPGQASCPEIGASILSRITYWWLDKMMFLGFKRPLTEKDMFSLHPHNLSRNVVSRFQFMWKQECRKYQNKKEDFKFDEKVYSETTPLLINTTMNGYVKPGRAPPNKDTSKKPSFLYALIRTFWKDFFISQVWELIEVVLVVINPLFLRMLIQFVEDKTTEQWKGVLFLILLCASTLVMTLSGQMTNYLSTALSIRCRAAIISTIYRKALTLTNKSRKITTVGEIVNLMSVDAEHLRELVLDFWLLWGCPLRVVLAFYFLFNTLGFSLLAGLAVLVALFPFQMVIMNRRYTLREEEMAEKDNRIKILSEVLNGIKILKLYAWELPFMDKILAVRNAELAIMKKNALLSSVMQFGWLAAPFLVSLAAFGTYVFTSDDHYLNAEKAFVALSYFNVLRFAVNICPYMFTDIIKCKVSLKRITNFLHQEDMDRTIISHDATADAAISIQNATFNWDSSSEPTLKNINLSVPEGSLVAVVGQVGAGKSSLISAILGEIEKTHGHVNVKGTLAYVPQQAWIQNDSLLGNILFGEEFREAKYNKIVESCALNADLEILPGKDQTEIGEKGINLSGGQKQRVSLARAVYFDADVYLLDDPLSAVDSHVGKHIFDKVVSDTGLLAKKTRVLVTHGVQWLPKVDQIIVLSNGIITESGSYEQLMNHDGPFAQFLRTYLLQAEDSDSDNEAHELKVNMIQRLHSIQSDDAGDFGDLGDRTELLDVDRRLEHLNSHFDSADLHKLKRLTSQDEIPSKVMKSEDTAFTEEETVEVGKVKWKVISAFLKSLGVRKSFFIFMIFLVFEACQMAGNLWLAKWTSDPNLTNKSISLNNSELYVEMNEYYVGVYGAIGIGLVVSIVVYTILIMLNMVKAAGILHAAMLFNVLRSPMTFFDTTPTGRIVNRFSHDVDTVDSELPWIVMNFLEGIFEILSITVAISYSTPIFLSVIIPIGIVYFIIQRFYICTSRQLKRLETKSKSPIYSHFNETLNGVEVIRAFGLEQRFIEESEKRKLEWNSDKKIAASFDDFWQGKSKSADVHGTPVSKSMASVDARKGWASIGLEHDGNMYSSSGYRGPQAHRDEDPLAGEFKLSSNAESSKQGEVITGVTSSSHIRGPRLDAEKHRQELEKLLLESEKRSTDSGFVEEQDDIQDDAIELLEDEEDLRREGVTKIPKTGFKLSRSLTQKEEPQVKLNINLYTGSVPGGDSFESYNSAAQYGEYLSDQERPPTGLSGRKASPDDSDDEFESVSQVTGPVSS
ncbi:hypothetical protein ScPMuIL_012071 [Solemya velum]